MKHTFRIVFQRSLGDDAEYFEERQQAARLSGRWVSYTECILAQLIAEINQNDAFKDRFRFSSVVSLHGDEYYCLGEIDYEGPDDEGAAFDQYMAEFQPTYDDHGMAGHYEVIPAEGSVLNSRVKNWDIGIFAPVWLDLPIHS